jgi:hypothetical protein
MATTAQAPAAERAVGGRGESDRRLYRIGAIAGFLTTAIALITNAVHPRDIIGVPTADRLERVAGFGPWLVIHLGFVVSLALSLITFVALYRSLAGGRSAWARPAFATVLVSSAVAAVAFLFDGFGLAVLAESWADASGAAKTGLLTAAQGIDGFENALFIGTMLTLFGATPIISGIALWTDETYPRWVAGLGIVSGVLGGGAGVINFLAGEVTDFGYIVFTIGSFIVTVWFLALSVLLWRRSEATV